MSQLIERAARALCTAAFEGFEPDKLLRKGEFPCPEMPPQDGEQNEVVDGEHMVAYRAWRLYVPQVRAVLLALRDPDITMIGAAADKGKEVGYTDVVAIWRAMIDAIAS